MYPVAERMKKEFNKDWTLVRAGGGSRSSEQKCLTGSICRFAGRHTMRSLWNLDQKSLVGSVYMAEADDIVTIGCCAVRYETKYRTGVGTAM